MWLRVTLKQTEEVVSCNKFNQNTKYKFLWSYILGERVYFCGDGE